MPAKKSPAAVKVAKPPRKTSSKGTPPPAGQSGSVGQATKSPSSADLVALNFSVPAEFRKEFHAYALAHDLSGKALLEQAFEAIKEKLGA